MNRIILLIYSAVFCLLMSGCGGQETENRAPSVLQSLLVMVVLILIVLAVAYYFFQKDKEKERKAARNRARRKSVAANATLSAKYAKSEEKNYVTKEEFNTLRCEIKNNVEKMYNNTQKLKKEIDNLKADLHEEKRTSEKAAYISRDTRNFSFEYETSKMSIFEKYNKIINSAELFPDTFKEFPYKYNGNNLEETSTAKAMFYKVEYEGREYILPARISKVYRQYLKDVFEISGEGMNLHLVAPCEVERLNSEYHIKTKGKIEFI